MHRKSNMQLCPTQRMVSLLHTRAAKNAHADAIWSCAWGRMQIEDVSNEHTPVECIVTSSVDDQINVWYLEKGKFELKKTLRGHSTGVTALALNSNCTICASSSALDSMLILWDLKTGRRIKSVTLDPMMEIWTITFSPDDNYIISASRDGKVNLFNVQSVKVEKTFDTRGTSISYSPDGRYIASGALDGMIRVFDVENGMLSHRIKGHGMPVRALSFSHDSTYLLAGSDDGDMRLYTLKEDYDFAEVAHLRGHSSSVLSIAFSPDSKYFVSGSSDRTVNVWQLGRLFCVHTIEEHTDQVWCVKFNKEGTKILSVAEDGTINVHACRTD